MTVHYSTAIFGVFFIIFLEPIYALGAKFLAISMATGCRGSTDFSFCFTGYGSVASPAKEEKTATAKNENQMKRSPASDSTQETVDGRRAFETWLFDKLPFITSTELQVREDQLLNKWKKSL